MPMTSLSHFTDGPDPDLLASLIIGTGETIRRLAEQLLRDYFFINDSI